MAKDKFGLVSRTTGQFVLSCLLCQIIEKMIVFGYLRLLLIF